MLYLLCKILLIIKMYFDVMALFSPLWWRCFLVSLLGVVGLLIAGFFLPRKGKQAIAKGVAAYMLFDLAFRQYYLYHVGLWNIAYSLPFDFCSIMQLFSGITLLKRWRWFYEVSLFIGVVGPLQAILTPAFVHGMEGYSFYAYFLIHTGDVFSPIFLSICFGMKPRPQAWWKAPVSFLPIVGFVGVFNYFVHGNYMFLADRPQLQHPAIVFNWPYYLVVWSILFFAASFAISCLFRGEKASDLAKLSENEIDVDSPPPVA